MRVASYLRVSTKGQVDKGGYPRQRQAIARHCTAKGYRVGREFREEAVSGTKGEDERPAFVALVEWCVSERVSVVVVESLDRLAREYRVQEQLLMYLAAKEIHVENANTGEDVTEALLADPMRRAMVQIQGVFAELERNLVVKRLREGRKRVIREHGRCGGMPAMAQTIPGTLSQMQKMRADGRTLAEIADDLNAAGIKTARGSAWTFRNVGKALKRAA